MPQFFLISSNFKNKANYYSSAETIELELYQPMRPKILFEIFFFALALH